MTVYLDASVLVGLFVADDRLAGRARTLTIGDHEDLVVSSFAMAEFSSVIARLRRMNSLNDEQAHDIFALFDTWVARFADIAETRDSDMQVAAAIIRRLELNVRAPDAINLAIARRLGAAVATFDKGMATNAAALGIAVTGV